MTDEFVLATLVLLFAVWCILHLLVAKGLARASRREALFALLLPPLAPVFAWRRGQTRRALSWGALALLYLVLRVVL